MRLTILTLACKGLLIRVRCHVLFATLVDKKRGVRDDIKLENCQSRYRSNTWMGRTCTDGPDEFEPSKFDCTYFEQIALFGKCEVFVPTESTIKICFKATRRLQSCENLHFLPPHLMCHPKAWCRFDHNCSTISSKCKHAELLRNG